MGGVETETELALLLVIFEGFFLLSFCVGWDPNIFFQDFLGLAEILKLFK